MGIVCNDEFDKIDYQTVKLQNILYVYRLESPKEARDAVTDSSKEREKGPNL